MQNANVGSYKTEGFVEVLAASQTPRSTEWFQGTADAVRQYIWLFEEAMRNGVEDLLILSGERRVPQLRPQSFFPGSRKRPSATASRACSQDEPSEPSAINKASRALYLALRLRGSGPPS